MLSPSTALSSQPHVTLLYPRSGNPADAIDHYCRQLAAAFTAIGWSARRSEWLDEATEQADLLVVQYNPFGFGRWGFAPRLPLALARVKRELHRPVVALMVHEAFVPIADARSLVMSTWQRGQLRAVTAGVDLVFHAVEDRIPRGPGAWPRRPTEYLAVAANVPDARAQRAGVRSGRGWGGDALVVATLGSIHPSKLDDWIAPALEAVAATGRPTFHADLGSSPMDITVPGVAHFAPGYLEAGALAELLAAADLFLAPYADGISGRRGSVMAALRNGVAVVSTADPRSDRLFSAPGSGLTLVGTDDPAGFARAARSLAEDDTARRRRAGAGLALYEERLDWPVIARRLADAARSSRSG